ncbi:outer membrane beta-barrel protein [Dyadobacter sp. CY326]|uniref:outer membrane beta-barrel protein n=1 Tax=Dyadobacter sp. CY326 TaxID=2907300 RepID=UPI001F3BF5F5|nr:outer membrane beta-barrel protein [Dyadobacter sp. CY326]MCE7067429.1 porin family protein [Dyadobacter sp. CY326]
MAGAIQLCIAFKPRFDAPSRGVFASYKYFVSDRLAIGGTTGFNKNVSESVFWLRDFTTTDSRILTMAGEVSWFFFKKPGIKLYAMAGLGFYSIQSSLDNFSTSTRTYGPTSQLTAFGVRFGNQLGVFTELGYGYKGIINTGLSIQF